MHDDDESDVQGEVEIRIAPREAELEAGGITDDEFTRALESAIDDWERDDGNDDQLPIEDRLLEIHGKSFRLGDLADVEIEVRGDIGEIEDDE